MTASTPPAESTPAPDTARIAGVLEGLPHRWVVCRDGMPTVEVESAHVHEALRRLRDDAKFETNTLVTALDRFPAEPRYTVVWQLLSLRHNERVRVYCPVRNEELSVPSSVDLWPGASFSERECYDMFGIRFDGHPDLRRLMMPEGYDHFPLRKDFPHQGIQPDRLYREWDRERRAEWSPEDGGPTR